MLASKRECPNCQHEMHQVFYGDRFIHFRCMKCLKIIHECPHCREELMRMSEWCPKCGVQK